MTRRQKTIAFFVTLCVLLVAAAVSLNIGWIVINPRWSVSLVLGILLFALIIAGLIVYTVFLVLEIKRNEEHDTFINAVTHELKTPIASIQLYLQTLQAREVTDEQRRHFYDIMLADADRLHHTVDLVLRAGATSHARKRPLRIAVDMAEIARESIELARNRHHLPSDAISFETHGERAHVSGDPDDLRTVLTNLLDNAIKYSGHGAVRVHVAVAIPSPSAVWVRVTDHGVGIPPRQLKRVFKRFYRVQLPRRANIKGTGLGLYIVKRIAQAHGGRVFAQSEGEDLGATFTLELPRVDAPQALASEAVT